METVAVWQSHAEAAGVRLQLCKLVAPLADLQKKVLSAVREELITTLLKADKKKRRRKYRNKTASKLLQ